MTDQNFQDELRKALERSLLGMNTLVRLGIRFFHFHSPIRRSKAVRFRSMLQRKHYRKH